MFLLFYLVCKCLPQCDVSYPEGWVWKRNVKATFLVATLVWRPPLILLANKWTSWKPFPPPQQNQPFLSPLWVKIIPASTFCKSFEIYQVSQCWRGKGERVVPASQSISLIDCEISKPRQAEWLSRVLQRSFQNSKSTFSG